MNKSRLVSLTVHASIFALVILSGAAVHRVVPTPVRFHSLIFPLNVPVPVVCPAQRPRHWR
jgi:hypothetical protein